MPVFAYRAVDRSGTVVSGTLTAPDQSAALAALQADGALPIKLAPRGGLMAALTTEITPRDGMGLAELGAFFRSVATLLGAGLPLDRALTTVHELGASRPARAVAGRLAEAVRSGASFADALDGEAAIVAPLWRGMVRAGEAGARLEETLADLAATLEVQAKRRGALRSALIYPAFLLATAVGAVALLLGYVVPTFEPLLDDAGVAPPAITQAVIAAGRVVEAHGLWILAAIALALIGFRQSLAIPAIRLGWHRALLGAPVLGRVLREFETARLTGLLGHLLSSGVALPAALRLIPGALSNAVVTAEIARITPLVESGQGLAAPLREGAVLPPLALQLIQVGEESGQLAPMLLKAAEIFDDQARRAFDNALSLVTPVLTLVMGVVIAVIISSILFALFSINELAL